MTVFPMLKDPGSYGTKTNVFFPPVVGRYIRLHPLQWYNRPTLRMEFYGCELDGCSLPLGMESGAIEDHRITASSTASSWYSGPWTPSLARLNRRGNINAWQNNNMNQWLQVELPQVKKITGIITQGAKSLGKEMFVDSYSLQYSNDGIQLFSLQTFSGNTNNNDHVKNYIYPPIFSRFIRIIPRNWTSSITMRIELLGCDFE
uniref:Coagulation factor V n=1 Tax=Echeneis naucrates TaxID=173247 RepID=A0A665V3Z0_ECHNA